MSSYRILVQENGEQAAQGTAWLVEGTGKVVTALHVIGEKKQNARGTIAWDLRNDGEADVIYYLEVDGGKPLSLQPIRCDPVSDIALLRVEHSTEGLDELTLSNVGPARGADWYAEGYWNDSPGGQSFSLTGHVAGVPGDRSKHAVQLVVEQGTDCSWQGMSGSPVCDQETGQVIGMLTEETSKASTLWAAHVNAVKRLLGIEVERMESTYRPKSLPLTANLPAELLTNWFLKESKGALESAEEHVQACRYEQARAVCNQQIAKLESAGDDALQDPTLASTWFDARLLRAACLLGLQRIDEAGNQARTLDLDIQKLDRAYLDHPPRPILLAQILAQTGDLARAGALVRDLPDEDARATRQHIEILSGHVPDDWGELVTEPFVRLSACEALLDRGEHNRAVGEALNVMGRSDLRPSFVAKAISVLLRAMTDSFYGPASKTGRIDAQRKRLAIAALQRHLAPDTSAFDGVLPERVLAPWILGLHLFSWDNARIDRSRERMREHGLDEGDYFAPLEERGEYTLVGRDDIPVWLRLMNEAYRLHDDGNTDQALDVLARTLAAYPERPMLERAAAALCHAKGEQERAVEHARRAYEAFPGHGQAILWSEMLQTADDSRTVWEELHDELQGSPNLGALRILAWPHSANSKGERMNTGSGSSTRDRQTCEIECDWLAPSRSLATSPVPRTWRGKPVRRCWTGTMMSLDGTRAAWPFAQGCSGEATPLSARRVCTSSRSSCGIWARIAQAARPSSGIYISGHASTDRVISPSRTSRGS